MKHLHALRILLRVFTLAAALLLGACATQPLVLDDPDWVRHQNSVAALADWELSGRLVVRQDGKADSVNINWLQREENFDLRLFGSLGLGAVHVYGKPTQVTVEKAGAAPTTLPSLGAVTQEYFGYEFPTAQMLYWVRGLPAPGLRGSNTFDSNRMLATLRQVDAEGRPWNLSFSSYMELAGDTGMVYLPGRIQVEHEELELTFLINDWEAPHGTAP